MFREIWKLYKYYRDGKDNLAPLMMLVEGYLKNENFVRAKDEFIYSRKTDFGSELLEIEFEKGINIIVSYGISFDEIENIYAEIDNRDVYPYSYTLYINSNNILGDRSNLLLKNKEDIPKLFAHIKMVYQEMAMKFYNRSNSLEKLSEIVNDRDFNNELMGNIDYHGSTIDTITAGIIAYHLLNKPNFKIIQERHLARLRTFDLTLDVKELELMFVKINRYFGK